ncbi:zinc finger protein 431-like [Wyeomyia smithii]|uniref:zinc finger protein 431-like n=1 Tax=Wyeomyia smithii TaxID=174621 RepID=UPI00246811C6|nr:zinc finger protein 431-like [Wyeomyia smithii]
MPCIVPTCLRSDKEMMTFPEDRTLASRWLEAIEMGSGHSMELAENECQPQICSLHFMCFDKNGENYEEPSNFIHRNKNCTQISGCRMCLSFHPTEDMVSLKGTLGEQNIAPLLELLEIDFHENQFLRMICLVCLARIEIFASLHTSFRQSEEAFQELLQKSRKTEFLEVKVEISSPQYDTVGDKYSTESEPNSNQDASDDEYIPKTSRNRKIQDRKIQNRSTRSRSVNPLKISFNNDKKPSEKSLSSKEKIDRNCYICDTIQPDANELMIHLVVNHTSGKCYRCDECSLDFPLLHVYNRHLSRHDDSNKPYKCSICAVRFSSSYLVKIHENRVHNTNHNVKRASFKTHNVVCDQCGKVCDTRRIKEHIQKVHEKSTYTKCTICDKTFSIKASLERHMLVHTKERPYSCDQCDKTFKRLLDYRHHKSLVHEGVNPHVCAICNEEFNHYRLLYNHKQIVHLKKGVKPKGDPSRLIYKQYVPCKLCRMQFSKGSELIAHIQSEHSEDYPVLECPHCPETFLLPSRLSKHKQIHLEKYMCKICGVHHENKRALESHMDTNHSDGQMFPCSDCSAKFVSRFKLQRHSVVHTKGKQFQCEYCEKSFVQKIQLVIHTRIHTGEKPFECAGCFKRFSDDRTFCKHKKVCKELLSKIAEESESVEYE